MKDKSCIACVNLTTLQKLCDAKILSAKQDVNIDTLKAAKIIKDNICTVRLLAKGDLKTELNISVSYASDAAVRIVEAAGGKIQITAK